MTENTTPAVIKALREQPIERASGGFGMYQATANSCDDLFCSISDLTSAGDLGDAYVYTGDEEWEQDTDTELVEAIKKVTGACYNEPTYLLAYRVDYGDGESVVVTGIDLVDVYEQVDGEFVTVSDYKYNPEAYALA